MNDVVIGMGQIGTAVVELLSGTKHSIQSYDKANGKEPVLTYKPDALHICFPYDQKFDKSVSRYITELQPQHIIIWSTLPIGTTKKFAGAVHSPVEGRHPELIKSIKSMVRWIGVNDEEETGFWNDYFEALGLKVHLVYNTDHTEFLKLRSTAKFGINLVWTDYEASVAKQIGMDFKKLKDFDKDYNKLYHNIDMDWAQRYILDPPAGKIGGHCVVPNAELLDEQFPNVLLKMIKEMK